MNPKPFETLIHPSHAETKRALKKAILKRKIIIVIGNCWVNYHGRASSKLEPGERVLMIKEDGSLLVHRSVGYEPVNWQPPGCVFHVEVDNNILQIHAVRPKLAESVKVFFDKIMMISLVSLVDHGQFSLHASEEDMQRALIMKPSLLEDGFKPISYEKKVEPGFVDVYGTDKDGNFVVVEIKRKTANSEAVRQLAKYVESVKRKVKGNVRGILVAPSISKGVQTRLVTLGLEYKALDPKQCADTLERKKIKKLEAFFESD
ncbi:MAG: endonuclease NucS [Candidatus Bathyarchaeota archaeon]|jgi:hypothetical protein